MPSEWISAKDRLPEETDAYLLYIKNYGLDLDVFSHNKGFCKYKPEQVEYWMRVPPPTWGEKEE